MARTGKKRSTGKRGLSAQNRKMIAGAKAWHAAGEPKPYTGFMKKYLKKGSRGTTKRKSQKKRKSPKKKRKSKKKKC